MAEGKYGRLFTEADVERIIAEALIRQHTQQKVRLAGVLEHLHADELTFPADEPLFLLRGQDLAAHGGAWSYAYEASRIGASVDFVTAALKAANDLREWQAEQHPGRVKIPD